MMNCNLNEQFPFDTTKLYLYLFFRYSTRCLILKTLHHAPGHKSKATIRGVVITRAVQTKMVHHYPETKQHESLQRKERLLLELQLFLRHSFVRYW